MSVRSCPYAIGRRPVKRFWRQLRIVSAQKMRSARSAGPRPAARATQQQVRVIPGTNPYRAPMAKPDGASKVVAKYVLEEQSMFKRNAGDWGAMATSEEDLGPRPGQRPCGHTHHHGNCPDCQRIQIERWRAQLTTVQSAGSIKEACVPLPDEVHASFEDRLDQRRNSVHRWFPALEHGGLPVGADRP